MYSITCYIVTDYSGDLQVQLYPGTGSTFFWSLPHWSFFAFVRHANVLALPGILPLLAVSNFAAKACNKTNNSSFDVVVGSIEGEKCTVLFRQSTPANRTGTPASLAM
jgi:hypothetical protein